MTDPRDPGWRLFGSKRSAPVVQLRSLFTITVLAIAFFPVALSLMIHPEDQSGRDLEPAWTLWPLVAGVAASLLGVGWARGRPLSGTTARALFVSYNKRFFIGFAFAELPTLLGFVIPRHNPAVAMPRRPGGFAGRVRDDGTDEAEHRPRRGAPSGRGLTGVAVGRAHPAPGSERPAEPLARPTRRSIVRPGWVGSR